MRFTLHVTLECNLRCSYCPQPHTGGNMDFATVQAALEMSKRACSSVTGFCFYGGEPLLNRELVEKTLALTDAPENKGHRFEFVMNTNGTLLDSGFLRLAQQRGMEIALSFDGLAQNMCRKTADGCGTFDKVEEKAMLLLHYLPSSCALTVIAPDSAGMLCESVVYLHKLGFKRVAFSPALGNRVVWDDRSLKTLKREYIKLSKYYAEINKNGRALTLHSFDAKINALRGRRSEEICHVGRGQLSVLPSGDIYPCTSLSAFPEFRIGNVFIGLDAEKQKELAGLHTLPDCCARCDIRDICTNSCGCANMLETGQLNKISPFQCEHERMLIKICRKLEKQTVC